MAKMRSRGSDALYLDVSAARLKTSLVWAVLRAFCARYWTHGALVALQLNRADGCMDIQDMISLSARKSIFPTRITALGETKSS